MGYFKLLDGEPEFIQVGVVIGCYEITVGMELIACFSELKKAEEFCAKFVKFYPKENIYIDKTKFNLAVKSKDSTYICVVCKKTFHKGWSDEDARKELEENFPDDLNADMTLVCDDCYIIVN